MDNNLSDQLKKFRSTIGKSQEWMAKQIGVSLRTYQNYEKGDREPNNIQVYEAIKKLLSRTNEPGDQEVEKAHAADNSQNLAHDIEILTIQLQAANRLIEEKDRRIEELLATIADLRKKRDTEIIGDGHTGPVPHKSVLPAGRKR